MSELAKCPFCGSDKEPCLEHFDAGDYESRSVRYRCSECLSSEDYWSDNEEEAKNRWNTRPLESALRAEVDALREALTRIRTQFFADGDDEIIALQMQEIARAALKVEDE